MDKWRNLVRTVINPRGPQNAGNFLTSWANVSVSAPCSKLDCNQLRRNLAVWQGAIKSSTHILTAYSVRRALLLPWRWRQYAPAKRCYHLPNYTASHSKTRETYHGLVDCDPTQALTFALFYVSPFVLFQQANVVMGWDRDPYAYPSPLTSTSSYATDNVGQDMKPNFPRSPGFCTNICLSYRKTNRPNHIYCHPASPGRGPACSRMSLWPGKPLARVTPQTSAISHTVLFCSHILLFVSHVSCSATVNSYFSVIFLRHLFQLFVLFHIRL